MLSQPLLDFLGQFPSVETNHYMKTYHAKRYVQWRPKNGALLRWLLHSSRRREIDVMYDPNGANLSLSFRVKFPYSNATEYEAFVIRLISALQMGIWKFECRRSQTHNSKVNEVIVLKRVPLLLIGLPLKCSSNLLEHSIRAHPLIAQQIQKL